MSDNGGICIDRLWMEKMCAKEPLPRRTEQVLATVVQEGGEYAYAARRKLVESNIRFAYFYAKQLRQFYGIYEDIVGMILTSMWVASETFKPVGVRFTVYAAQRIKWDIARDTLRNWNKVALPATTFNTIGEMTRWVEYFKNEHLRDPDKEELVEQFGEHRADAYYASRHTRNLDEHARSYEGSPSTELTYKDLLQYEGDGAGIGNSDQKSIDSDEQSVLRSLVDGWVSGGSKKLQERNREILRGRFYEDKTLEELGKKYRLSRERIRQVEAKFVRDVRTKRMYKWFRDEYQNIFPGFAKEIARPVERPAPVKRTTSREIFIYPE